MVIRVHGFDWAIYSERIMSVFARWLIEGDEVPVYQLFEQTRCAQEEQFLPVPMYHLRVWSRAAAFMLTLPRGSQSQREYTKLCSAEQFTALSDRYLHQHPPQLYQNSDAVRSIWGALIEDYCLPWYAAPNRAVIPFEEEAIHHELVTLLHEVGLGELASEVNIRTPESKRTGWETGTYFDDSDMSDHYALDEDEENEHDEPTMIIENISPQGIILGQHPNILRLRGWLASSSVRAMTLFEYLACGRRIMPFGYRQGEPPGNYIGYVTPNEAWQFSCCLKDMQPPRQEKAEEDFQQFRRRRRQGEFCLVDEVLPAYADEFVQAVHRAARQGLGLICEVE